MFSTSQLLGVGIASALSTTVEESTQHSAVITDNTIFSPYKAFWVQAMHLYLIFRFVKGRCHGNQVMLGLGRKEKVMKADLWWHRTANIFPIHSTTQQF